MRVADPGPDFDSWRSQARALLAAEVPPHDVLWERDSRMLFGESDGVDSRRETTTPLKVPAAFVELARHAACHRDPVRWTILYRLLWRIVKNGERHLLSIPSDPDLRRVREMEKNVRREIHKMHAFVRFRKVEPRVPDRERFVSWFEPGHAVVKLGAPFFRKRFPNFDWSIFTPLGCAHWDGEELVFTEGVESDPCGNRDALEAAWRTYYKSIFNPARLKTKAMQAEMPKRYWRNLPEAELIEGLVRESSPRVRAMAETELLPLVREPSVPYLAKLKTLSPGVTVEGPPPGATIAETARLLGGCQACPLWEKATRAVPGEGPSDARIVIIGEQPGDQEDLHGKPFVGPAGLVLNRCLEAAGIDRSETYVTNAVKHFKWEPRGKIRLHQKPSTPEIKACRQWYERELAAVRPDLVVAMGATAAQSVFGKITPINRSRGRSVTLEGGTQALVTVHPSYLLRLPDEESRKREYRRFVDDLRLAARLLKSSAHAD